MLKKRENGIGGTMKKTLVCFIIATLLLACIGGCSDKKTNPKNDDSSENRFVGTWTVNGYQEFALIFKADMTFTVRTPGQPVPLDGTYTIDGDKGICLLNMVTLLSQLFKQMVD